MSSFVMDKKQFIKAAGFCAGLADCKSFFNESVLRLWNYSNGAIYTGEDFYNAFVWLFNLNALSVQRQYNDSEPCKDTNKYIVEFNEYRKKTSRYYQTGGIEERKKLVNAIYQFHEFCNCLLYQVEDPDCEMKIKGFIYRLEHELMGILEKLSGLDVETWGDFEME